MPQTWQIHPSSSSSVAVEAVIAALAASGRADSHISHAIDLASLSKVQVRHCHGPMIGVFCGVRRLRFGASKDVAEDFIVWFLLTAVFVDSVDESVLVGEAELVLADGTFDALLGLFSAAVAVAA